MQPTLFIPKVLIVNDNVHSAVAFRSVLAEGIERREYEVVLAYSGEEALRQLLQDEFAVVLLDIKMPMMDGFETADAIHSNLRLASLPIIFVTAHYDDDFHRLQAYQKGAVDYVFMPVNPKILQTKISIFVELARQKHALKIRNDELHTINDKLRIRQLCELDENSGIRPDLELLDATDFIDSSIQNAETGLLNRKVSREHLEHALSCASRYEDRFALVVLEIGGLEEIHASFGTAMENSLLGKVAESMQLVVRHSDLVARLERNKYAVLLKSVAGFDEAVQVGRKIARSVGQISEINGQEIELNFNIGIAIYPQDGKSPSELLKSSDLAMYPCKQFFPE